MLAKVVVAQPGLSRPYLPVSIYIQYTDYTHAHARQAHVVVVVGVCTPRRRTLCPENCVPRKKKFNLAGQEAPFRELSFITRFLTLGSVRAILLTLVGAPGSFVGAGSIIQLLPGILAGRLSRKISSPPPSQRSKRRVVSSCRVCSNRTLTISTFYLTRDLTSCAYVCR